ncbi:MAG TPA: metallophosphoesterase [Luteibaculaceae bacterium]|nr:metallophosphoesterase [Luteibaculaceae bacterium]
MMTADTLANTPYWTLDPDKPLVCFGGAYSNLHALTAFLAAADAANSTWINTGDAVGYCAFPEEVVQHIQQVSCLSIAGNVEQQLADGSDSCGCNFTSGSRCDNFSQLWYPYAQTKLSSASLQWMRELPAVAKFTWGSVRGAVIHGGLENQSQFIFYSTPWQTKAEIFDQLGVDLIIAGHCGLPFYQTQQGKHWFNPGVIGMPANNGGREVWYGTIQQSGGELTFEHVPLIYDHAAAAKAIRDTQLLPTSYALTLETGIWDNCEILPPRETALQGQTLPDLAV